MERDRLKAKLSALRDDHKRKVMIKILGRLANMQYFVAWSAWYNVTVKMHHIHLFMIIMTIRIDIVIMIMIMIIIIIIKILMVKKQ